MLTYLLDLLYLHDALTLRTESISASKVMKNWGKVIHSINSAWISDMVLVINVYFPDKEVN